jgi:hypothetical protein
MFKPKSPSKYFLRRWKNRKYFQKNRLRHSESQPHRLVVVFEVICMNGMESGDPKVLFSLKTFIFDTFYHVFYYVISTRYRFRFIHANPLAIPPNGSYDRELSKKPKISKNERAAVGYHRLIKFSQTHLDINRKRSETIKNESFRQGIQRFASFRWPKWFCTSSLGLPRSVVSLLPLNQL